MEENKQSELNELRSQLHKVDEEYDKLYDERQKLRDQVLKLELEVESDVVTKARNLLETNKFLRLNDTEIIYVCKFNDLSDWDERFYLDGDVIDFKKSDDRYFVDSVSEMTIGHLSDLKLIKPMTKDEVMEVVNSSNVRDLINSINKLK